MNSHRQSRWITSDLDFVARIGGEEFAVVLNATALDDAVVASERLRLAVRRGRFFFGQQELGVTISLGIAEAIAGETAEELFQRADAAVYASKDAGRDCTHFHNQVSCEPFEPLRLETVELVPAGNSKRSAV